MIVDVTFSWYETGNLDRERELASERGATITEKVVERHQAFLARRDTTGAACSATAAAGTGVLSWWVQFRGQRSGDPCKDAEKLLDRHPAVRPVTMAVPDRCRGAGPRLRSGRRCWPVLRSVGSAGGSDDTGAGSWRRVPQRRLQR